MFKRVFNVFRRGERRITDSFEYALKSAKRPNPTKEFHIKVATGTRMIHQQSHMPLGKIIRTRLQLAPFIRSDRKLEYGLDDRFG